jgi:2-methylcitrate dehydratase PrpD
MDRIETEVDPKFEAEFPAKAPAEVVVITASGDVFRSGRMEALWEPPDTLPGDGELEAKFIWLAGPVIGKLKASRLAEQIWRAHCWAAIDPIIYPMEGKTDL